MRFAINRWFSLHFRGRGGPRLSNQIYLILGKEFTSFWYFGINHNCLNYTKTLITQIRGQSGLFTQNLAKLNFNWPISLLSMIMILLKSRFLHVGYQKLSYAVSIKFLLRAVCPILSNQYLIGQLTNQLVS